MSTLTLDRTLVQKLVREALQHRLGNGHAAPSPQPLSPREGRGVGVRGPKLVVNVSARHCHVTQEDLERLYGKGHQLTPYKWLYQDGFFAAEEAVTIIGPRQRMITTVR